MPKKSRFKKKTDQKSGQEFQKVERLVLYAIGKSRIPLSTYDIEKEVVKQIPGSDQQKYTYVTINQLVPHEQVPYIRLFSINDFFDCENSIKEIPNDDERNRLNKRVIHKVFESYWRLLGGKEDDWECSIPERDKEVFVINIKHRRKEKKTLLRFVFRKKGDSNQLSSSLFYNNNEIRLCEVRSKGTTKIYSVENFPYLHLKHHLDEVPKCSNSDVEFSNGLSSAFDIYQISARDSPREDSQFILNLRGLLRYVLLNVRKTETEYRQINEVIETLAQVDRYHDLEEEFEAMDPVKPGFTVGNKIFLEKKTSNYKIKVRFPFLSYYNEYKECLPLNFAVNTLYEIAIDLQNKLEEMNIFDLKYEVTQKFFIETENEIWGSSDILFFKPVILKMDASLNTIRTAYNNYQHEICTYLKVRKEKEIKILEKRERKIQEELKIVEFRQKVLSYIENEDKDIISTSEILRSISPDVDHRGLTGTQFNIIKNICEFKRRDYQYSRFNLFKRSLIEEIDKLLTSDMDYETVKKIMKKKGVHDENVLTEILNLNNYGVSFDKKTQIDRIVRKNIPKL